MNSKAFHVIHHTTYAAVLCLSVGLAQTSLAASATPTIDVFSTNGEWHELSADRFSRNGEYHEQTGSVVAASAAEPYPDNGTSDLNKILAPTAAGVSAVTEEIVDMTY